MTRGTFRTGNSHRDESRLDLTGEQRLGKDVGGAAASIVVLLAALLLIALGAVEADGDFVLSIDVQPDCCGAGGLRGGLKMPEEDRADALLTMAGGDLDGGNVGDGPAGLGRDFDDGEAGQPAVLFSDPGCATGTVDEVAHVAAPETKGRLKADLFDGVELGEVVRVVEAVVHG